MHISLLISISAFCGYSPQLESHTLFVIDTVLLLFATGHSGLFLRNACGRVILKIILARNPTPPLHLSTAHPSPSSTCSLQAHEFSLNLSFILCSVARHMSSNLKS